MTPFEYVIVLTSLILGLGITQILMGISDLVSYWKRVSFSWPHAIYVLVVFFLHIQEWWINYQYGREVEEWSLPLILCVITFPIFLFLQARMLFPTGNQSTETDLRTYFQDQWKGLYIIGSITVAISIFQNVAISQYTWFEQIPLFCYLSIYLIFILGNIRKSRLHILFGIVQLIAIFIYVATEGTSMSS